MKVKISSIIKKPITGEWGNDGDNIKVLRTTNFTNEGRLTFDSVVTRDIDVKIVESKKLLPGDIIIEKSGGSPTQPVGRVVFFNEEGTYLCNNFTSILRPIKKEVFPKYLLYLMFCNHKYGVTNRFQNKTTGIINLQLKRYIYNTEVPLPPISTQKKIAAILDAADQYRQKTKILIEKYDQLAQALFLDMFGDPVRNPKGWKKVKLNEVCTKITDGTHFSPEPQSKGFPYVTAKHVKDNGLDFYSKPTFISEEAHNEIYKRCTPEFGDVLYIKDGATTGIACINTFEEPISLLSSLALLKLNKNKLNNHYLCYWLNHNGIKQKLLNEFMSGAAIQRYTLTKINSFVITAPPIKIQNQFAERIQLIEQQKQQAQTSLQKAEDLFNSALQRAFNGKLV